MGPLILDASVLVGLLDKADAQHHRAVDDVKTADEASTQLVVPPSAYSKALVAFAHVERISEARDAIAAMGIRAAPLDARVAERGANVRARHSRLRLPDAIVLAIAQELRGDLLSYDEQLARYASIDDC